MSHLQTSSTNSQPGQPPPRATTAPVKKHHIPHHPHRPHVHHRNGHGLSQSAIEPRAGSHPFGDFKDGSRSNMINVRGGEESMSRDGSRRGSGVEKEPKKVVTWAEVERARWKNRRMDEDLLTILSSLSTLSTTSTRRFDYAYYSLLERISIIISTVNAFLELSQHTTTLRTEFDTSIEDVQSDFTAQISSYDESFDDQREKIEGLEKRLQEGKVKVYALCKRLEAARCKVESWGERERDWQARTSRRLRILWYVLGAVGWLFIVLLGIRHWRSGVDRAQALGGEGWNRHFGLGEL